MRFKKLISIITMACMIATMLGTQLTVFAYDDTDTVIKVSSQSVSPGSEVTLDVSVQNNPGIMGMALRVDYDTALTLTDAASGKAFAPLTMTKPGKYVSGCKFVWDGQDLGPENIIDGTILSLTFKVPDDAANDTRYAISVYPEDPIDSNLNPVDLYAEDGEISVLSYLPGDVDGDFKINTTDVIKVRRFVAGGYDVAINERAANVNGDAKINTTDVILMRRFIAGGYGVELLPDPDPATGHTHSMIHTDKVDATCTEQGNIEYWMCSSCGKYYTDVNGLNEITKADTVIEAKGHTVVIDPRVEPTTEQPGLTEGSHCSVCGVVIVAQQEIPPLDDEERYTINYHLYDGDNYLKTVGLENPNPSYYVAGTGVRKLLNLSADGYIFDGWYDGEGASADNIKSIAADETGDIDLYARWRTRQYQITFDSPLVPTDPITYTVNRGATLTNPSLFGYTFMGWSDEHANIITSIPKGTTGDITLTANWTSLRNQTRTIDKLGAPLVYEDQENGQYLFMYEIGQIENVPLYEIKNFGNSTGITISETFTTSKNISQASAESIVKTIAQSTTNTDTWTLSKEWNDSLTHTVTHTDEHGSVIGTSTEKISKDETVTISSKDNGGNSTKVTTNSHNVTGTVKGTVEANVPGAGKIGGEVGGSIADQKDTEKGKGKTWNTTEGKNTSKLESTNTTTNSSFSSKVSDTYGYNKTHSEGGSETNTSSASFTSATEDEYASSLTYTTGTVDTTTKTYSNASAPEGYYRLVCAGIVHVFGVVGYDVATESFYVYTMGIQDDNTYDFVDYSKTTPQFNDEENGVLPFEIPYEINDIVADKVRESKGLEIDKTTGFISSYTGNGTEVYVPDYIVEEDVSGNKDVIQVKGIMSDAFKNNTAITSVRLGKYVTEIPSNAFSGCTSLKSVEAPSITKIGSSAFKNCASLTSVTYSNVNEIGSNAFDGCTSLSSYTVTDKVTSVGTNAFKNVKKVEVDASSVKVLTDVCSSGAKRIVLYTDDISDKLKNTAISVPDTVEYLEWNGGGKTYEDIILSSKAGKTVLNKLNVTSTKQTPFNITSPEVAIGETTVNSSSWPMILSADSINMTVQSDVVLNSSGKGSLLTKDLTLQKYSSTSTAKLKLSGDAYVCSSITDPQSLMEFTNSSYKVVTINDESFESLINDTLEWVLESEVPAGAKVVAEKWTYDETTTKTSSSSTMAGYTLYDTTWVWGAYGAWSDWSTTKYTASDSRKVETRTIPATYTTQYNYSRWASNSNNTGNLGPIKGTWGGVYCQYYFERGWGSKLAVSSTQYSAQVGGNFNLYGNNQWFNETTRQVVATAAYTQYRYCDRSKVYTYHFKKVESKESDTAVTASGNISNVKRWVKYVVS